MDRSIRVKIKIVGIKEFEKQLKKMQRKIYWIILKRLITNLWRKLVRIWM